MGPLTDEDFDFSIVKLIVEAMTLNTKLDLSLKLIINI
jgi:hypothetical protein